MIIKNKYLYYFCFISCIILLFIFTFIKDPFIYNYSMFSCNIKGHILLFILCFLLGLNLAFTTYLLNKKKTMIAFVAPLIGSVFPYRANSGDLFSNMHEVCAYISFFLTMYITLTNIEKYKTYNFKKAIMIRNIFIFIFIFDGMIYFYFLGVKAIEEFILLLTIVLIHVYFYIDLLKKEKNREPLIL